MSLLNTDIRDLDIIIKELTSNQHFSCAEWYRLGLLLGLYNNTLKEIERNYRYAADCFRESMSAWLRGEDKVRETEDGPSWASLVSALELIGENSIATIIKEQYCC